MEVLTGHGNELCLFGAKAFPHAYNYRRASDKAAVGATFNVFSYGAVWPNIEPITFPTPSGCATCYATDAGYANIVKSNLELVYFLVL